MCLPKTNPLHCPQVVFIVVFIYFSTCQFYCSCIHSGSRSCLELNQTELKMEHSRTEEAKIGNLVSNLERQQQKRKTSKDMVCIYIYMSVVNNSSFVYENVVAIFRSSMPIYVFSIW